MSDETTPEQRPKNVIEAIACVMREMPGIGKDAQSPQGYAYRGIEAITKEAQKLFGRYCVVFVPKVISRKTTELSVNNKPWTQDELEVVYRVYGPGGVEDFIEVGPLVGLGRDNSDKGANKALTQCYKYALLQVLTIGDSSGDTDGARSVEADHHPRYQNQGGYQPAAPRQAPTPAPRQRPEAHLKVIAEWPSEEAFDQAHTTYGEAMAALSEEQRIEVKSWKTDHGIGWPLTPDQYEGLATYITVVQHDMAEDDSAPDEQPPASRPVDNNRCSCGSSVADRWGQDGTPYCALCAPL